MGADRNIQPPDLETRLQSSEREPSQLPDDVALFVASGIKSIFANWRVPSFAFSSPRSAVNVPFSLAQEAVRI